MADFSLSPELLKTIVKKETGDPGDENNYQEIRYLTKDPEKYDDTMSAIRKLLQDKAIGFNMMNDEKYFELEKPDANDAIDAKESPTSENQKLRDIDANNAKKSPTDDNPNNPLNPWSNQQSEPDTKTLMEAIYGTGGERNPEEETEFRRRVPPS